MREERIAVFPGSFDPVTLRAVDDPAADRFIEQPMREPWRKEMFG